MATRQKARRSVKKAAAGSGGRASSKPRADRDGRGMAARRQPETLRVHSMTPTYTVNDLQKSIAWYCDGLGFVVSDRWEEGGKLEGVMLKAGSCTFALTQDDFARGRDRVKGVGFRIHADTRQNVDELAKRIRDYGGRIIQEPADMPWGTRSFAVEDPDGFRISFNQAR